jgi:hypothetical protein
MEFIELTIVIAGFHLELRVVLPKVVELLFDSSKGVRRKAMDAVKSFAAQGKWRCNKGS